MRDDNRSREASMLRNIALHCGQRYADYVRRQIDRGNLHVAQRVAAARQAAGLTRTQLAQRACCTRAAITRIEQGTNVPQSTAVYAGVAYALGLRVMDLWIDFEFEPYDVAGENDNAAQREEGSRV